MSTAPDARALIRHEADALIRLADELDTEAFERAVELLVACRGNVATVGMGTSGIVARKIAATLTSTGTPAHFVHPSDALHGGLGLIGGQAVITAVSNGGETEEILALLPYVESRGVPVVAIVGNAASSLGRRAQVTIEARVDRETGTHDIVPTASVVAQLAVADALALTVMDRKSVTPEGFALNHPSGRLGRRLTLRVGDVMHAGDSLQSALAATTLLDALSKITADGLGAVAVVDGDRLVGLITDGDVRRVVQRTPLNALPGLLVGEVMTADPVTVDVRTLAYDALRLMEDRPSQIHVLPVLDGGRFGGILRLHDLVRLGL